jgi:hypothetical protein
MDSEFVKECTSEFNSAEKLCPEISSFLKSMFSANAVADRLGGKYRVSAYRNVLRCRGIFGCD